MLDEQKPALDAKLLDSDILDESSKLDADDSDMKIYKKWGRDEDSAVHWIKMVFIYGIPALAVVIILTYLHHIAGPHDWRWLTDDDLREIRGIAISVLSGVSSSIAVGYFFRNK